MVDVAEHNVPELQHWSNICLMAFLVGLQCKSTGTERSDQQKSEGF